MSEEIPASQDTAIEEKTAEEQTFENSLNDSVVASGMTEANPAGTELSAVESVTEGEQKEESDPRTHRFECRSCGYVYDPEEGVKKQSIPVGTAFEDLDTITFRCPVCRSKVGAFRDIGPRSKASGFEENLNYGLGVNRLTPGQKNVLIFGSLALGFAFFLSLYSLR